MAVPQAVSAKELMYASSARAQQELGFRILPVQPAMRAAIEWFRAHGYARKAYVSGEESMATKRLSRFAKAMLETAEGMHRLAIMDDATYRGIVARHGGKVASAGPLKSAEPAVGNKRKRKGSSKP